MLQNHLTQMLAVTAMEPPGKFEPEAIRNEKAKVLQASKLADENEPGIVVLEDSMKREEIA